MNNFFKEILIILLKVALPIIVVFGIVYISFNFNFEFNPKIMYFKSQQVLYFIVKKIPLHFNIV